MPIRVEPFAPIQGPDLPLLNGFNSTMGPMSGTIAELQGLGGSIEDTLGKTGSVLGDIETDPGAVLEPNVTVHLNNLNGNLDQVVEVAPPRIVNDVKEIKQDVTNIKTRSEQVFNNAKKRVTTTRGIISLALVALCVLFASILQKFIAELLATLMRIQRAILAFIDGIRKAIENFIRESLEKILKALPDCSPFIKEVAKQFRSIVGKVSQVVAKVNEFLRKLSDCFALADGILSFFDNEQAVEAGFRGTYIAGNGNMTPIVETSHELTQFDAQTMKKEFSDGFLDIYEHLENQRLVESDGLVFDETTGELKRLEDLTEEAKKRLEELLKETDPEAEYKKFLEDAIKEAEELKKALEKSKEELYENMKGIIDQMVDSTKDQLSELEKELQETADKAAKEIDEMFEKLKQQAEEFDSPEFQEKLITACMNTEIRVVVE